MKIFQKRRKIPSRLITRKEESANRLGENKKSVSISFNIIVNTSHAHRYRYSTFTLTYLVNISFSALLLFFFFFRFFPGLQSKKFFIQIVHSFSLFRCHSLFACKNANFHRHCSKMFITKVFSCIK